MEQINIKNLDVSSELISEVFKDIFRLREELDCILETLEILSDKDLMESLKRADEDIKFGRVQELKSVDDLDEIWSEE
ncbi:MAG: hypothetical protein ACE5KT_00380 [Methanosarcinales archaeon]